MSSTLHINADEDMMQLVRDDDCLPRSSKKKPFSKSASESRLRIVRPSTSPRTRSPNSRYLPQMTLLCTVRQLNFLIFGNRRASSSKIDMNDRSRTGSRRSSVNNIASDCQGLTVPKKRLTKCPSESRYVGF